VKSECLVIFVPFDLPPSVLLIWLQNSCEWRKPSKSRR